MTKHLLALGDCDADMLDKLIERALGLKAEGRRPEHRRILQGRVVSLLFDKPSTRTRVSFESAVYSLGGDVIFMASRDTQLGRGEPLKDMARVMSRYVDALVVRTFGQEVVEELAAHATVPVINALTDLHHPCQILSDVMTVREFKGDPAGLKIVWLGDGNNMANSWIEAASVLGFPLTLACPEGYGPDSAVLERARRRGGVIHLLRDPAAAVEGADVINVDVWASMGQEAEQGERLAVFQPYQLGQDLLARAADGALVLHCLPAHRGEEITDEVLEGPRCRAFDQAENKMHIHRAILEALIASR